MTGSKICTNHSNGGEARNGYRRLCRALAVVMVLAIGACASGREPERPRVVAEFLSASEMIVRATGPGTFLGADLLAPDGRIFPGEEATAAELERQDRRRGIDSRYPYGIGVGASGGSTSGVHPSIGISLPLRNPFETARPATSFGAARIRLPVAATRQSNWQDWRIIVRFSGDGRTPLEIRQAPPMQEGN